MSSTDAKLTDKEIQVLGLAWKCFKTPPEVDYEKLAKLTGYANPRSVQNLMGYAKKKIAAATAESGEEPATPAKPAGTKGNAKAKATPASRKRKAKSDNDDDDNDKEDVDTPAPAKRARATATKKKAVKKEEAVDDEMKPDVDNDEVAAPTIKGTRATKKAAVKKEAGVKRETGVKQEIGVKQETGDEDKVHGVNEETGEFIV